MVAELASKTEVSLDLPARQEGGAPRRLPSGWLCGRNCEIVARSGDKPVHVELVLMHPALGIALLDTEGLDEIEDDREGALRARLAQARFSSIFGGRLPIIQGSIEPEELDSLPEMLTREFQELPPLTVGGGEAWVATVSRILVPRDPAGWTDNLDGAPPEARDAERDDADRPACGWWNEGRTPTLLRRALPAEEHTRFDRLPRPKDPGRKFPWLPLSLTGVGALALAGLGLVWSSMAPPPGNMPSATMMAAPEPAPAPSPPPPPVAAAAARPAPAPEAVQPPPERTAEPVSLPMPPPPPPRAAEPVLQEEELPVPPAWVAPPPQRQRSRTNR